MAISREKYISQPSEIEHELKALFSPNDNLIIFDIGACEGEDSIRYSRLFKNSKIYAFEPLPSNCELIKGNLDKYFVENVEVVPYALSKDQGEASFYTSSGEPNNADKNADWDFGNKSSSLLPPNKNINSFIPWLKFTDSIKVQTETLNNFCKARGIEKIDFIHLDVQGAELKVIEGAEELIKNIKAIWLEVEKIELYDQQPLKHEIEYFMKSNHFYKIKDTVDSVSGDQLYVNTTFFNPKQIHAKLALSSASRSGRKSLKNILGLVNSPSLRSKKISYSQSGEDLIIKYVFDDLGIQRPSYIDVGAHEPTYLNNTYLFYSLGSSGINIEPDSNLFKKLQKFRKRDINLNIGVSDKEEEIDLYIMSSPSLNTCDRKCAKSYIEEGYSIKSIEKIRVDTISHIIKKYFGGIFPDLLTLDVEGLEEKILRSIDYEISSPTIICVETINFSSAGIGVKKDGIISFLESKGYLLYADTYINSIFVRRERWIRE